MYGNIKPIATLWRHRWSLSPPPWRLICLFPKVFSGQFWWQWEKCLSQEWEKYFSLLRQECPPILTPGEMLSHPGRWDKPILEVIHLWRHSASTPNSPEKSLLVCVLDIFCTFLGKNEKNNQSPHWGRYSGIPSSCPRFATSTTRQASSWIANLGHSDGIPSSLPQCGVRFYYSPTWDWDLSNFPVLGSCDLTQAKYTWPCKHWVLLSTTLWCHIHYYDVTRRWRQYGGKRMEVTVVYCFLVLDFIHFASRRKIILHQILGGTQDISVTCI